MLQDVHVFISYLISVYFKCFSSSKPCLQIPVFLTLKRGLEVEEEETEITIVGAADGCVV